MNPFNMNFVDFKTVLLTLITDYLIKDKRFTSLYKEYALSTNLDVVSIDDMADNLFPFIMPVDPAFVQTHYEVMRDYVIYRLFIYACGKRMVNKLGDNITYIDPVYKKEVTVTKQESFADPDGIYLTAVDANDAVAQLQIEAIPLTDLMPLTGVEPLKYPVKVTRKHRSGQGNSKPAVTKNIGDINKSQILTWFTEE